MRLRDLDAHFVRYESRVETRTHLIGDPATWNEGGPTEEMTGPRQYKVRVETLAEAQGVMLRCPVCAASHYVDVTFSGRGVADEHGSHDRDGKPVRWVVSGTSLDDLTTKPSINCDIPWKDKNGIEHPSSCKWHGFVTAGDAT